MYVACTVGSGDDDPTSIVVIDARSGRVAHYSVLSDEVALRVDETSALPFIYASGAHPIRIDARTGRQLATLQGLGPIFKAARGRLFTLEEAGHRIAVVDERTGETRARYLVGLSRDPSDIDLAPSRHRAYIAFRAAATLGIYNGETGNFQRTIPTGDYPAAVYADAARNRVFAISGGGSASRTVLDVFRADGTHRRSFELDPNRLLSSRDHLGPSAQIVRDERSGRYVIADSDSMSVFAQDAARRVFSLRTPTAGNLVQLELDPTTGDAFGFWNSGDDAIFMRLNVRTGKPRTTHRTGAAIEIERSAERSAESPPPVLPGPPPFEAPAGLHTPLRLAAGRDGQLAVSLYGERSIGIVKDGKYTERRLNIHGFVASIAVDRSDAVWFSEYSDADDAYVGRLDKTGSVRETKIATSASPRTAGSVQTPPSLVTGNDGYIWGFDAAQHRVLRIDDRGNVRSYVLLAQVPTAPDARSTVAARPGGGVYVANERLWSVESDGTARALTAPLDLGPVDHVRPFAGGVRFIASDLIVTVSPRGGLVGVPIDRFTVSVTHEGGETRTSVACEPRSLAIGKDGVNWVACGNAIIRVDENGRLRRFALPAAQSEPTALTVGSDGAIWFAEPTHSTIGVLKSDGSIREYRI